MQASGEDCREGREGERLERRDRTRGGKRICDGKRKSD